MNSNIIVGIPIKSLDNPMSRLSESISLLDRKKIQLNLIKNTVNSFKNENIEIYLISNDLEIVKLANQIEVSTFNSKSNGLNSEVKEFIKLANKFSSWAICHADLPYLNKYNISVFLQENLDIKKSFNKEFSFEIDDEEDFNSFRQHRPRWSKNLEF